MTDTILVARPPHPMPARVMDAFRPGDHQMKMLHDLRADMCRWPFDCDDGATRFCGERTVHQACSYCREHLALSVGRDS